MAGCSSGTLPERRHDSSRRACSCVAAPCPACQAACVKAACCANNNSRMQTKWTTCRLVMTNEVGIDQVRNGVREYRCMCGAVVNRHAAVVRLCEERR